jgi:prolyl-tRNA synthetase
MNANRLPSPRDDFPGWYLEVVKRAELAEHGPAKGSMIIKPHGYAIWEHTQRELDDRIKATGHENVYFPLLIPMSLLEREADHVEGFAPQVAVVTHGGGEKLEEPLAIRPTSEAVIWNTYKRWIQSYRDLPLLYNQWCNVLRWEMRTRLFLRTSEFLWQEGHTAHATGDEAMAEARQMLEVYRQVAEDVLAIPVFLGRKSAGERFPGAVETFCIEGLMRDAKALQCGTSHFLGQNFGIAYDVTFINAVGEQEHAWGTSWGFTTRMVGATIMAHGDEAGLRLPPAVAPVQVAIVPIYRSDDERASVIGTAERLRSDLAAAGIRVRLDDRDQFRPGYKFADWELKGVPVRIELGPRDVAADRAGRDLPGHGRAPGRHPVRPLRRCARLPRCEHARDQRIRRVRHGRRGGRWVLAWRMVRRRRLRGGDRDEDEGHDPLPADGAERPRPPLHALRQARRRRRDLGQGLLSARPVPRWRRRASRSCP